MAAMRDGPRGPSRNQRQRSDNYIITEDIVYSIENTVIVNVDDNRKVRPQTVITEVERYCGLNTVLAIIPRAADCYELTLSNKDTTNLVIDGVCIGNKLRTARPFYQDSTMVSILHIPAFIQDEAIRRKFSSLNIEIISPIKRHTILSEEGNKIPDGTRFFRCKFPPEIKSLPYLMRFEYPGGSSQYKVLHNDQRKICHKCWSTDHLLRQCPQVKCNVCHENGHIASDCYAERCCDCGQFPIYCECENYVEFDGEKEKNESDKSDADEDEEFTRKFFEPRSKGNFNLQLVDNDEEENIEEEVSDHPIQDESNEANSGAAENEANANDTENAATANSATSTEKNVNADLKEPTTCAIGSNILPSIMTPVPQTPLDLTFRRQYRQNERKIDQERTITRRRKGTFTPNLETTKKRQKGRENANANDNNEDMDTSGCASKAETLRENKDIEDDVDDEDTPADIPIDADIEPQPSVNSKEQNVDTGEDNIHNG